MYESVTLLVASLYAEAIKAVKSLAALSASIRLNFDYGWYSFRGEALKPMPISEFFSRFPAIRNFDMIQYVEYYW
jgi:hypothetical protein